MPNQSLPAVLAQSLRPEPVGVGVSDAVKVVVGIVLAEDEEDLVLVAEVTEVTEGELVELAELDALDALELDALDALDLDALELAEEEWVVEKEVE